MISLCSFRRLTVAVALSTVAVCTFGQSNAARAMVSGPMTAARADPAAQEKAQGLLAAYVSGMRGRPEGVHQLMQILQYGLPKTAQNATALRGIVGGNITEEEKVIAIRLPAVQYDQANSSGMNHLVLADLKQQANSGTPRVAAVATFGITRLGYMPDSLTVFEGRPRSPRPR